MQNTERLIYIDDLSGLYNRRYLYYYLPPELKAAQAGKYSLWLFMLDIDDFKMINDTYGHLCGDQIIQEAAKIIVENTKSDDKKIRYAGDEFTVILPKLEIKDVINVAQRLLAKLKTHVFKEKRTGKEIRITMSLGIAGYPQDAQDPIELINLADKSLYISKQKGKNCVSTAAEITPDIFWKRDILDKLPCPLFIEREAEIARLKNALSESSQSGSRVFLITGELGVGKSRLLNEFGHCVINSAKAVCLAARCEDKFFMQPYYCLGDILYKYFSGMDKIPESIFAGFTEPMLGELANFMPVLKNIPGSFVPDVKNYPPEEGCLGAGLIRLFQNISKIKPLCLFFDNAHYIDQRALEVISRLAEKNKEFPILIVAAFSAREISSQEGSSALWAALIKTAVSENLSEILTLTGLTAEGTRKLIANIFTGVPLSANLVDLICKITQGNPLFVEELSKCLIEKEYLIFKNGRWIESRLSETQLPLSIEDTIRKRIEELSPETKEMIAKAAVIGDDFQVDLLQKIDSEDKGYILDLIEAAKKIGLIYKKETTGNDEFSFVTGEIRRILSEIVGNKQMKRFHSRIGQIKEKLHFDNISSIAGELYYNFKKAEDWARVEQYAKIIKEGKAGFYDQTMRYARSLLREVEGEKLALPLSEKAAVMLPELIRAIYLASVNYILYPPQSIMRLQTLEEISGSLARIFSETDALALASLGGELIVNNKRLSGGIRFLGRFMSLLKNANIECVEFEKETSREELSKFIDAINNPKNINQGIALAVERSGISHIKVKEISYGVPGSKEKESLQEVMLIDYILGKLSLSSDGKKIPLAAGLSAHAQEITQALDKFAEQAAKEPGQDKESVKTELMAKSIQKIGKRFLEDGTDNWLKYKADLAKTLLSMEPGLRANVFGNQPEDNKEADVIKELSADMPDDIILDVLSRQYQEKDMDLDKVRNLAQRFFSIPGKKEKLAFALKEKFQQLGALEEECDWILDLGEGAWNKLSGNEKADKLISFSADNFFKLLPMTQPASLIKELLSGQKETPAEGIADKLLSILTEQYPRSKSLTGIFSEILDTFIEGSPQKLFPKFIQGLTSSCPDKQELLLSILNPHFDQAVNTLLANERFDLIKDIARIYTQDGRIMDAAVRTFAPIIPKLIKELIRRIDFNLDWADLADLLILFGDPAAKILIEEALFEKGVQNGKYFEAYARRFTIGKILNHLPKEYFLSALREKCLHSNAYIIKNLIELLGAIEDEEAIKILRAPLTHADITIRRKTIFTLGKLKGRESAALLGEALKDADASLRKYAGNILRNRKDDFALQALNAGAAAGVFNADFRITR